MSCFKLLNSLCSELESLMARFWWGLWRIGDGCIANLWVEPWVPGTNNLPKPSHLLEEGVENLTVNYLIDAETNSWNKQLVRSTFNPMTTTYILKIRLSPTLRPN